MLVFDKLFNRKRQSGDTGNIQPDSYLEAEEEDADDTENPETEADTKSDAGIDHPESEEEYPIVEREIHPAKIICPDCGGITLEGLDFCDKCGGELQ